MTDKTHPLRHPDWTFLNNHTHVLHCIFLWPDIRIRDIAAKVLITERAVQRIVVDLEAGGYLKRVRVGRQNHYRLKPGLNLRHPLEDHVQIGRLLAVLQPATTVGGRMSSGNARRAAIDPTRRLTSVGTRTREKTNSPAKKRPALPRKLVAKRPI